MAKKQNDWCVHVMIVPLVFHIFPSVGAMNKCLVYPECEKIYPCVIQHAVVTVLVGFLPSVTEFV
jgi:hypothetical protein